MSGDFDDDMSGKFVSPDVAREIAVREAQKNPEMGRYWADACKYVGRKNGAEFNNFDDEFRQWEESYFAGYPPSFETLTNVMMPFERRGLAWLWMTE